MPGEPGAPGVRAQAAHDAAVAAGEAGYLDPDTRLFVFTAVTLAGSGRCCDSGCRHCPWRAADS